MEILLDVVACTVLVAGALFVLYSIGSSFSMENNYKTDFSFGSIVLKIFTGFVLFLIAFLTFGSLAVLIFWSLSRVLS